MRTPVVIFTLALASRAAVAGPITRTLCNDSVHILAVEGSDPKCTGACGRRYALTAPWRLSEIHQWFPVSVWFGGHGSQIELVTGDRYLVVVRAAGYALGEAARCSSPDAATIVARLSLAPLDRFLDLLR